MQLATISNAASCVRGWLLFFQQRTIIRDFFPYVRNAWGECEGLQPLAVGKDVVPECHNTIGNTDLGQHLTGVEGIAEDGFDG